MVIREELYFKAGNLFHRISEFLILHAPALNIRVSQMMPRPVMCPCTGSGWDSSWYGAVFYMCEQSNADNTIMF